MRDSGLGENLAASLSLPTTLNFLSSGVYRHESRTRYQDTSITALCWEIGVL